MKRKQMTMAILMAACVFAGCGNQNTQPATQGNPSESAGQVSETNQEPETNVETTTEIAQEPVESTGEEFLSLSRGYESDYQYDENSGVEFYTAKAGYVCLNESDVCSGAKVAADYPALASALDAFHSAQSTQMADWLSDAKTEAPAIYQESGSEGGFAPFSYQSDVFVQRADTKVLSLLTETTSYQGGAHGSTIYTGTSYDVATGEQLQLSDVLTDTTNFSGIIAEKIMAAYGDNLYDDAEIQTTIESMLQENTLSWILGYQGLDIYFSSGDIAPYAAGMMSASLKFDEVPDMFSSEYTTAPEAYAIQIPASVTGYYDLDGDGTDEAVVFNYLMDEYNTYTEISLTVDDQTVTAEPYCYTVQPTLLHTQDGKNYLYVDTMGESDSKELYVFDASKTPVLVGSLGQTGITSYATADNQYRMNVLTNPQQFALDTRTDLLSTGSLFKEYAVGTDGMPASSETEYRYTIPQLELTSKVELTVTDEAGNEVVLPAQTVLTCISTDNDTYVNVQTEDGSLYRMDLEKPEGDEWQHRVNGYPLEDALDGVYFAG